MLKEMERIRTKTAGFGRPAVRYMLYDTSEIEKTQYFLFLHEGRDGSFIAFFTKETHPAIINMYKNAPSITQSYFTLQI